MTKEQLTDALTTHTMYAKDDHVTRQLNLVTAIIVRDAMAKDLYMRLFVWLVNTINKTITQDSQQHNHNIGLLDIFGFESFGINRSVNESICVGQWVNMWINESACE